MTEEDVQVLLDSYAAWNRGEHDTLAANIDPNIEWEPAFQALDSGAHQGAEGFQAFVTSWLDSFEEFRVEPELIVQKDDTAIMVIRQSGRGRGSGIELEARVVHVWRVRDRKAVAWWGPRTFDEALEALGDDKPRTVLRGYEAFNCGELDEAISMFDPEIEWDTWIVPGPGGATYRGHAGVWELWSDARNVFGDFRNDAERIISAGDKVVAFVCVRGRGKESGAEVEGRIAHLYTFRGEKVLKVESYENRQEALEAAGLG